MGTDTYLLFVRRPGVSRAEISEAFDRDLEDFLWHPDGSFSYFTGIRFYEWEQSAAERRIRLTLAQLPPTLFDRVEPWALAWPDAAAFTAEDDIVAMQEDGTIRVDFHDFRPDDPRLEQAAASEAMGVVAGAEAMSEFMRYQEAHPDFGAELLRLADERRIADMIARTRAIPELAPLVDVLVEAGLFEAYVRSTQYKA